MKKEIEDENILEETNTKEDSTKLCRICNEKEQDRSENSNSFTCKKCRDEHKKLKIPFKINFFLVAICTVFVLSIIKLPPIISDYKSYKEAEIHMENKEYSLAYKKYIKLLEKYNTSLVLAYETADAALNAQYFTELNDVYNNYLSDKEVNDEQYKKAIEYTEILDAYIMAYEAIDNAYNEIGEDLFKEDIEEATKQFKNSMKELLKDDKLNKTLIYFYLSNWSIDLDEALEYMRLSSNNDSRFTYSYSYYGNIVRTKGDFKEAEKIYNLALKRNATDALSIRGLSILRLLEGAKEESLKQIRYAYELEPYYNSYITESLIITLYENSLKEEADTLLKDIKSNGFLVEEEFQKYLDGEITFKEYYVDGK